MPGVKSWIVVVVTGDDQTESSAYGLMSKEYSWQFKKKMAKLFPKAVVIRKQLTGPEDVFTKE